MLYPHQLNSQPLILGHHTHPRPALRRAGTRLLAFSLGLGVLAAAIQLILALTGRPLFFGTALLTAILTFPLWMQSVLHPTISRTAAPNGLILKPALGRARFVPRETIRGTGRHPLMQAREVTDPAGRLMFGKNYRPREGMVVFVERRAGLSFRYRLLAVLAGMPGHTAFAINSAAHTDYRTLAETIAAWSADSTD